MKNLRYKKRPGAKRGKDSDHPPKYVPFHSPPSTLEESGPLLIGCTTLGPIRMWTHRRPSSTGHGTSELEGSTWLKGLMDPFWVQLKSAPKTRTTTLTRGVSSLWTPPIGPRWMWRHRQSSSLGQESRASTGTTWSEGLVGSFLVQLRNTPGKPQGPSEAFGGGWKRKRLPPLAWLSNTLISEDSQTTRVDILLVKNPHRGRVEATGHHPYNLGAYYNKVTTLPSVTIPAMPPSNNRECPYGTLSTLPSYWREESALISPSWNTTGNPGLGWTLKRSLPKPTQRWPLHSGVNREQQQLPSQQGEGQRGRGEQEMIVTNLLSLVHK